jgi:hypothetical protein
MIRTPETALSASDGVEVAAVDTLRIGGVGDVGKCRASLHTPAVSMMFGEPVVWDGPSLPGART